MSFFKDKVYGYIESNEKIVSCLFMYIDRMNDLTQSDNADKVLAEFLEEVTPLINEHLRVIWND